MFLCEVLCCALFRYFFRLFDRHRARRRRRLLRTPVHFHMLHSGINGHKFCMWSVGCFWFHLLVNSPEIRDSNERRNRRKKTQLSSPSFFYTCHSEPKFNWWHKGDCLRWTIFFSVCVDESFCRWWISFHCNANANRDLIWNLSTCWQTVNYENVSIRLVFRLWCRHRLALYLFLLLSMCISCHFAVCRILIFNETFKSIDVVAINADKYDKSISNVKNLLN